MRTHITIIISLLFLAACGDNATTGNQSDIGDLPDGWESSDGTGPEEEDPIHCKPNGFQWAKDDLCFECNGLGDGYAGSGKEVDDKNPCTDDLCDMDLGIIHTNNAEDCDDGLSTTWGDTCEAGVCVGKDPVCEPGAFYEDEGSCFLCAPDGSGAASQPQQLDDGNPCTDDSCAPEAGLKHLPNTAACDDGDPDTYDDVCANSACAGVPLACSPGEYFKQEGECLLCNEEGNGGEGPTITDGNVCTDDICDPVTGLAHVDNTGACNDGDPNTIEDTCAGGECVGIPLVCAPGDWFEDSGLCFECADSGLEVDGEGDPIDDGSLCTDDLCDVDDGVLNVDNTAPCDDDDPDTVNDQCFEGDCVGLDITCDEDEYFLEEGNCKLCDGDGVGPVDDGLPVDDGNVCTDDSCDPDDGLVHAPNALLCDDDNPDTVNDTCALGLCNGTVIACTPGQYLLQVGLCAQCNPDGTGTVDAGQPLDNGNPCTDGSCHAVNGVIQTNNEAPCDDENPDTAGDTCGDGTCAGDPVICEPGDYFAIDESCFLCNALGTGPEGGGAILDDGNLCTDDECDPDDGVVNDPNHDPCDDGDPGTTDDECADGVCVGDEILCPKGNYYMDQNLCFLCNGDGTGAVGPGVPIPDDGNDCTADVCDAGNGVEYQELWGTPCDDGDAGTALDECQAGICVGELVICTPGTWASSDDWACYLCIDEGTDFDDNGIKIDDGNDCTDDVCDANQGLLHTFSVGPCSDGDSDTVNDTCNGQGVCIGGEKVCPPGNYYEEGALCYLCDGDGAGPVGPGQPITDDGNECTDDICDPGNGVDHQELWGTPCSDGDPDTAQDECDAGICAGEPIICSPGTWVSNDDYACYQCIEDGTDLDDNGIKIDDDNDCTDDACDLNQGVLHSFNTDPCSDGDPGTVNDTCNGQGACVGGGKVCPPGNYYEDAGLCYLCDGNGAGPVGPGAPIPDDGNECTADICDPGNGVDYQELWGTPCDDGDADTVLDECDGGICVGEEVICPANQWVPYNPYWCELCNESGTDFIDGDSTSDENDCTDDECDPDDGVIHIVLSGDCWDGSDCTYDDACVAGECVGTPVDCNDYSPCTADSCDPDSGCLYAQLQGPCDDGIALTLDDTCIDGICIGMVDPDGDGIPNYGPGGPCDGPGNMVNCVDNCPYRANANQVDSDNDGQGDACEMPRWWTRVDTTEKVVALTFDDGWSEEALKGLLKALGEKGARASFFLAGQYMEDGVLTATVIQQGMNAGHVFGNHTYHHTVGNNLNETVAEITQAADAFESILGDSLRPLYRHPYADIVPWINIALVQTGYMESVLGNFDAEDWTDPEPDPQLLADCIVALAGPGDIIGFHIGPDATVAALPAIIDGLHAKGYTLLNIEQMMAYGPPVIIDETEVKSCSSYWDNL